MSDKRSVLEREEDARKGRAQILDVSIYIGPRIALLVSRQIITRNSIYVWHNSSVYCNAVREFLLVVVMLCRPRLCPVGPVRGGIILLIINPGRAVANLQYVRKSQETSTISHGWEKRGGEELRTRPEGECHLMSGESGALVNGRVGSF